MIKIRNLLDNCHYQTTKVFETFRKFNFLFDIPPTHLYSKRATPARNGAPTKCVVMSNFNAEVGRQITLFNHPSSPGDLLIRQWLIIGAAQ